MRHMTTNEWYFFWFLIGVIAGTILTTVMAVHANLRNRYR